MLDKIQEIIALASQALECQHELGCREIILENLGHGQPNINAVPVAPDRVLSPELPAMNLPSAPMNDTPKRPIPDYGPIPPVKNAATLLDPAEPTERPVEYTDLESHFQAINQCTLCPLGQTRTKFVYGVGNPSAKIMFIGEAPGHDEDIQGEPFVGRAGKLLDKILSAVGLDRKDVYIANILKCRPPNNRDPQPDEMQSCMPYLKEQIRLIGPQFICSLGRISAQGLLGTTAPLGSLRRRWHRFENIPLIVTYHPAALLRFPKYKWDTWDDVQVLMKEYHGLNNV